MILAAVLLTVGAIAFTLLVRDKDLPKPEPKTGYEHLDERKARIYEGLRDLQFEYRVGKLSEADYNSTKLGLQAELTGVLAAIDKLRGQAPPAASPVPAAAASSGSTRCPHCNATFPVPLKFCGQCGKAMA